MKKNIYKCLVGIHTITLICFYITKVVHQHFMYLFILFYYLSFQYEWFPPIFVYTVSMLSVIDIKSDCLIGVNQKIQ